MENASKALLMAGGVLIGVLIISLAVYLFADFGSTSAKINAQNAEKQLATFNSKFTVYLNDDDKETTIYDLITLKGYAEENNKKYEDEEDKIYVKIKNNNILNKSDKELINNYVKANGSFTTFNCTNISYNNKGKVKEINFNEK